MLQKAFTLIAILAAVFLCGCSPPSNKRLERIFDDDRKSLDLLVEAFADNPALHVLWLDGTRPQTLEIGAGQLQNYRTAMRNVGAFRVEGHKTELRVILDTRSSRSSDADCETGFMYKADRLSAGAPAVESLKRGDRYIFFSVHLVVLGNGWYRYRSAACEGGA